MAERMTWTWDREDDNMQVVFDVEADVRPDRPLFTGDWEYVGVTAGDVVPIDVNVLTVTRWYYGPDGNEIARPKVIHGDKFTARQRRRLVTAFLNSMEWDDVVAVLRDRYADAC